MGGCEIKRRVFTLSESSIAWMLSSVENFVGFLRELGRHRPAARGGAAMMNACGVLGVGPRPVARYCAPPYRR